MAAGSHVGSNEIPAVGVGAPSRAATGTDRSDWLLCRIPRWLGFVRALGEELLDGLWQAERPEGPGVLKTWLQSILDVQKRYAHVTVLRGEQLPDARINLSPAVG